MAGKIFYRERTKVGKGEKKPRFRMVAIADITHFPGARHLVDMLGWGGASMTEPEQLHRQADRWPTSMPKQSAWYAS